MIALSSCCMLIDLCLFTVRLRLSVAARRPHITLETKAITSFHASSVDKDNFISLCLPNVCRFPCKAETADIFGSKW